MKKIGVVALGGNAIIPKGSSGDIHEQFANTRKSLSSIVELVKEGYRIAITHGNGPQAGHEVIKNELAKNVVPPLPLGVIVAATEGWMGYMIAQSLINRLRKENIKREVVTIPTQVVVSPDDPSWENPTKPIGPFLTKTEAEELKKRKIPVIEDAGRGWRRVVPSPKPLRIVERKVIKKLVEEGVIVIAGGGGGIPVYIEKDGSLEGLDGVIDKDLASAVLARDIGASMLIILTGVERVYLNYGTPEQIPIVAMDVSQARRYMEEGHFAEGSMKPKIEAAINFIEWGGEEVIITSLEKAYQAITGSEGTKIRKSIS